MPHRSDVRSSSSSASAPADALNSISFYIGRVYYTYVGLLQRLLEEAGLDIHLQPGMGHILFALFEKDDLIIKDLVSRVQLSPSTMTGMLKRMERAGLIDRRSDGNDGRAVRVRLTPLGRSVEQPSRRVLRKLQRVLEKSMSEQEVAQLKRSLSSMIARMRQVEQRTSRGVKKKRAISGPSASTLGSRASN